MNLIKVNGDLLFIQCNLCKKEFTIENEKCFKTSEGYEAKENLICDECGQDDKSIIDYKNMLKIYNVSEKSINLNTFESEKKKQIEEVAIKQQIKCPECGSTQFTSN